MTEKKLKKLYAAHAEDTAPDMDALWKRIEDGLEEKAPPRVTSAPARKKFSVSKAAVWGTVCAAVLIILPIAARNSIGSDMSSESDSAVYETAAEFAEEYADDAETVHTKAGTVYYENLDLAPTDTSALIPSGETGGDDYFVEENVLVRTDVIVNAYVEEVYSMYGTVYYTLAAEDAETHETTEPLYIESASPYIMRVNRSYILPLTATGDGYSLAFENAPQIEETRDGGLIFHNGWECLADGNEEDVIYPQGGADDFFYDRMKFSYSADAGTLVKKWRTVKDE